MRRIILLIVLLGVCSGATAGGICSGFRSSGYYFRPPRSTFFYRSDDLFHGTYSRPYFYSFAPYGSGYGYGYPPGYGGYGGYYTVGRFSPFYPPGGAWVGGGRGTYSAYLQTPAGVQFVRTNTSDLIFTVTPARAQIYIDGKLIGSGRDYSSHRDRYEVINGQHELRIEYPGYKPYRAEMNIQANRTVHVEVQLAKD